MSAEVLPRSLGALGIKQQSPLGPLDINDVLKLAFEEALQRLSNFPDIHRGQYKEHGVLTPTKQKNKIDAVGRAIQSKWPNHSNRPPYLGVSTNSGKSMQPWKDTQAIKLATSRLLDVMGDPTAPNFPFIWSMESFIDEKTGIDYCVLMAWDRAHKSLRAAFSQGCQFPAEYVEFAKQRGTVTVGDIIHGANPEVTSDDPHKRLCGVSRYTLLSRRWVDILDSPQNITGVINGGIIFLKAADARRMSFISRMISAIVSFRQSGFW
ncbi:hypothetical protein N7451_012525 [Penicillium sp. IBT 35674x]|nr:hypothetical protein N7451_012525 [Penicillium sp. IBT 35674x]